MTDVISYTTRSSKTFLSGLCAATLPLALLGGCGSTAASTSTSTTANAYAVAYKAAFANYSGSTTATVTYPTSCSLMLTTTPAHASAATRVCMILFSIGSFETFAGKDRRRTYPSLEAAMDGARNIIDRMLAV